MNVKIKITVMKPKIGEDICRIMQYDSPEDVLKDVPYLTEFLKYYAK